jgi:hypothetical protein
MRAVEITGDLTMGDVGLAVQAALDQARGIEPLDHGLGSRRRTVGLRRAEGADQKQRLHHRVDPFHVVPIIWAVSRCRLVDC